MKVTVETITPAVAKKLLADNVNNRHLRQDRINLYALLGALDEMLGGPWSPTA